jgi:hypothetical protein
VSGIIDFASALEESPLALSYIHHPVNSSTFCRVQLGNGSDSLFFHLLAILPEIFFCSRALFKDFEISFMQMEMSGKRVQFSGVCVFFS